MYTHKKKNLRSSWACSLRLVLWLFLDPRHHLKKPRLAYWRMRVHMERGLTQRSLW